jgi:CheY-like chemotaxis protein
MTESPRLLAVDDNPDVCFTLCAIAQQIGFETRVATSHKEYLQHLNSWDPTHLLLDLQMPEVDGVQTLQHLASLKSDAAIIATSGLGTRILEAAARAAAENGLRALGTLSKPFSPRQLRQLLQSSQGNGARKHLTTTAYPCASAVFQVTEHTLGEALRKSGLIHPLTRQVFETALGWFVGAFRSSDLCLALNVSAIVELAHTPGLHVTAEGVEDEWTLNFLCDIQCDAAQGYHIARPMDGEIARHWTSASIPGIKHQRASHHLAWSDDVYEMFDLPREAFGNSYDAYLELVHPEDRDTMADSFELFEASGATHFEFAAGPPTHRVDRQSRMGGFSGSSGQRLPT